MMKLDLREGPISLETRMAFVLIAYFAGLFLLAQFVGALLHIGTWVTYVAFAAGFIALQNLAGPALLGRRLHVHWLDPAADLRLQAIVRQVAEKAVVPTPRVGTSALDSMNAFTFGRTKRDSRICVTQELLDRMSDDELKAVVAHEVCHIRSWDVTIISLLAVVPVISQAILQIPDRIANGVGRLGSRLLLRIVAFVVSPAIWLVWLVLTPVNWFATLLMNSASRVSVYAADREAVKLGVPPHHLASALYKVSKCDTDIIGVQGLVRTRPLLFGLTAHESNDLLFFEILDADDSGDISAGELLQLRSRQFGIPLWRRVSELFSPHPLLQRRFERLAKMRLAGGPLA